MTRTVRFTCPIKPEDIVQIEKCINPQDPPDERIWVTPDIYFKLQTLPSAKLYKKFKLNDEES